MLRLPPDIRAAQLATIAVEIAAQKDYRLVRFGDIARLAGCGRSLVQHYFINQETLRAAIMAKAVEDKKWRVIAQGIVAGDSIALSAPEYIRKRALKEAGRGN
jgi:AcrR family transcriptional regulator